MKADQIAMTVAVTAASTGLLVQTADAQIVYTNQNRFVEIAAFLPGETQSEGMAAEGFGLFDQDLSRTLFNNEGSAWAHAAQTSSLQANAITATGAADGAPGPPVGTSAGLGRSSFSVEFTLTQAVDYTLDLDILGEFASWSFQGPSLDIDRPLDLALGDPGVHLDGTLAAGDYAFSIFLESGAAAQGFGSNYDFSFVVVPAPAGLGALAMGGLLATRRRR